MNSETSMVEAQYRLQEFAAQIRECQNQPDGMSVVSWCACHSITKVNYYYRFRCVREACPENYLGEVPPAVDSLCSAGNPAAGEKEQQCSPGRTGYLYKGIIKAFSWGYSTRWMYTDR